MPNPKLVHGNLRSHEGDQRVEGWPDRVPSRQGRYRSTAPVGKASFAADKLADNIRAVLETVVKAKPSTAKGTYSKKIKCSPDHEPGIKIDPAPYRG
jgi:ribosomal protein L1